MDFLLGSIQTFEHKVSLERDLTKLRSSLSIVHCVVVEFQLLARERNYSRGWKKKKNVNSRNKNKRKGNKEHERIRRRRRDIIREGEKFRWDEQFWLYRNRGKEKNRATRRRMWWWQFQDVISEREEAKLSLYPDVRYKAGVNPEYEAFSSVSAGNSAAPRPRMW